VLTTQACSHQCEVSFPRSEWRFSFHSKSDLKQTMICICICKVAWRCLTRTVCFEFLQDANGLEAVERGGVLCVEQYKWTCQAGRRTA